MTFTLFWVDPITSKHQLIFRADLFERMRYFLVGREGGLGAISLVIEYQVFVRHGAWKKKYIQGSG
jgi:hypothetical protein